MIYLKSIHEILENKSKKSNYTYGCAMLFFDFPEIKDIHNKIDKKDIYDKDGFGLETGSHTTLLYGFHSENLSKENEEDIFNTINKTKIDNIILYNVSLFENEKYDVLKFDINDKEKTLHKINKNLTKKFPYTNDYPDYHPHTTIAYLKSGRGKKYVDLFKNLEYTITPTKIVYSKPFNKGNDKLTIEFNI